jgi:hypothetical protein
LLDQDRRGAAGDLPGVDLAEFGVLLAQGVDGVGETAVDRVAGVGVVVVRLGQPGGAVAEQGAEVAVHQVQGRLAAHGEVCGVGRGGEAGRRAVDADEDRPVGGHVGLLFKVRR